MLSVEQKWRQRLYASRHHLIQAAELDFLADILGLDVGILGSNVNQLALVLPAVLLHPVVERGIYKPMNTRD